jgi:predicted ATPase/DNA-binding XRE family transcriptional regulator
MTVERFADHLRRHRQAAGLTQEELAERSGLSVRGISDLERGVKQRPHPETVRLLATALGLPPDAAEAFRAAAIPADQASHSTIPEPLTPLVDREEDVQAVSALLESGARLVTLTGPGGVGKTRLSIQVAREVERHFVDGVAFVHLAGLSDPDLVPGAIAKALTIRELPDRPLLDLIAKQLQNRHLLLVMDNFEHLLPAATQMGTLLAACRKLAVLATSRSSLHIIGEREHRVWPLARPERASDHSLDELASFPAITLFVHQAQAAQPSFEMTNANSAAVTAICTQVEGLPLALELAAVRMKTLAPSELESLLENRLGVLTRGPQDHPVRHRTMRSTIAWSHDLLPPEEQDAFRRFAVFVGGATRESAAAVLANGDDIEALDLLTALLDQSLLQRFETVDGESRFTMLETIREFALDRLIARAEEQSIRDLHASYFLDLSERGESELNGPNQARWMNRLETEYGNLRTAMAWLIEREDASSSQRMGSALWHFWAASGRLNEGRDWLDRALALSPGERTATRAQALLRRGNLAIDMAGYLDALRFYEESLAILQELGDELNAAGALTGLGIVHGSLGNYGVARGMHESALQFWTKLNRRRGIALAQMNLGVLAAAEDDYARAGHAFNESRLIRAELDDPGGMAWLAFHLGHLCRLEGNIVEADRWLARAQAGFAEVGDRLGVAYVHHEFGCIAHDLGRDEVALFYHLDALREREVAGAIREAVECMEELASIACVRDQLETGVRMLSAAEQWRQSHGVVSTRFQRTRFEATIEYARAQMSHLEFDHAWREGSTTRIDEALDIARTIVSGR